MKTMVISLGGSLIVPEKIDFGFLKKFRKTLRKHYRTHKFVIVCGGGSIARKYITLLRKDKAPERDLSLAGIRVTRMNALILMELFGKEANDTLPTDMKGVKDNLQNNNVVICGALRFAQKSTSDSTSASIAHYLKSQFINMTNVKGLYSANPLTHKNARFIPKESWKDFEKRANAMKYRSGQHFVLDQRAATLIRKHKIKTYIIGKNASNISKILKNKKFTGTLIYG